MKLPVEFTERLKHQFGDSYTELISAFQELPVTSVRINSEKIKSFSGEKIPWTDSGYYLPERPSFTLDPLLHAGAYYVQEASSMFIEQVFKQLTVTDEPLTVLDLCAAPGGKSTHIASLLNEKSMLVSNEVINSRAKILSENIIKWGSGNVVVTHNDPKDFSVYENLFDVILIDAPCSGEGLFRKDKNAVTEWSAEHARLCSVRQKRIMSDMVHSLKSEGLLIYSTCTFNPEENERNVEWLCNEYELECLPLKLNPDWGIEEQKSKQLTSYHFYPHKVKGEGLFLSVMKKNSDEQDFELQDLKQKVFSPLKKEVSFVKDWIKNPETGVLLQEENKIKLLSERYTGLTESFKKNLRVIYEGTEIGEIKNNEVIPSHSLAMFMGINKNVFDCIELSKDEALKYLRKEEINFPSVTTGWKLITYSQTPLGWVKHLGKRINNYYPTDWRIRMKLTN